MEKIGASVEEEEERLRLKRELKGLILADDYDQAISVLTRLRSSGSESVSLSLSLSSCSGSGSDRDIRIPDEFRCPISTRLMADPVILPTGITYDRQFIEKWLKEGRRTCPQTRQILTHTLLTPNHLVRDLIRRWCINHGIKPPIQDPSEDKTLVPDADHLILLLNKMSSSLSSDQKSAAKQLRSLTKRNPTFRSLFINCSDSISRLLYPLSPNRARADPDLREDIITTLLNISIHDDDNKKRIAEDPLVIPILIDSLNNIGGTVETRSSAAAALFTLSALDSNKYIIGKSGAIKPLIKLLDEGNPMAIKDAASAIFNLCVLSENRGRAVRDGAVNVILKKIKEHILVDEMLTILALLSGHHQAIEDMEKLGAMACLFTIIKGNNSCERSKENCIAMIYNICQSDRSKLCEVREEEVANGTLSKLAKSGTSRAKRKSIGLLEKLNKKSLFAHSL